MESKSGLTSEDLLQTVSDLMEAGSGFDTNQPVVLSCGGIQLKGRKIPKNMASWQTQLYLPKQERARIRTFRIKGESTKRSLQRILNLESLN